MGRARETANTESAAPRAQENVDFRGARSNHCRVWFRSKACMCLTNERIPMNVAIVCLSQQGGPVESCKGRSFLVFLSFIGLVGHLLMRRS